MKTVTVILTTYNAEKNIERTISSILQQKGAGTDFNIELIVIDDCSTDNTVAIVKKFPVVFFSTERNTGGPNKGRNIGLRNATGDFICIADHDDEWLSHRLSVAIPYMDKAPIVTSGYTIKDESQNKNIEKVSPDAKGYIHFPKNETFLRRLTKSLSGQNTYLGSIMYRKELKDVLFEEHFGMVDYDWVLKLFHQNDSIEISDALYTRYVAGSNLSLNESYRRKDFYFSLLFIESYEDLYPREVRIAYKKIHGSRARYYYLIGNMKKARFYFLRSTWNLKTAAYYFSTFIGSGFVKKRFRTFG